MRKQGLKLFILLFTVLLIIQARGISQQLDTIRLSIPEAEQIFLQKNLALVANHYNIDINKALVLQAKVWDNPVVNTDQTLYDGKFFRHTNVNGKEYGQVFIQIQQLIRTAGKIRKQTQLAKDNLQVAEADYSDMMRNLKYTLSTDMNTLARIQRTADVVRNELESMQGLARGMDEMLKLGDVSQKENIRVRALLFSLQSELNSNLLQQYDLQKEIGTILQLKDSVWVISEADKVLSAASIDILNPGLLKDSAFTFRPDLLSVKTGLQYQQHNLLLQQALKYPDLTVGTQYDHINSYVPNYFGLDISLPLPVFNRNKGNVTAASYGVKQGGLQVLQLEDQIGKEIQGAWMKLKTTTSLLNTDNSQLQSNYDVLLNNMVNSYRQRQIGLIEFIDFFDAYRETRSRQWQLVEDQRNAAAQVNYVINQPIIKL